MNTKWAKYIAYDADNGEFEFFKTLGDAEDWLRDGIEEGIGEEATSGHSIIARITHRSQFRVTDRKDDYHEHTADCPEDCDEDEWPHPLEFDEVGSLEFVEDTDESA